MNTRRILARTCFLVLILGANVALSAAPPFGVACGDGRVDTILDNFDSAWTFCCTADAVIPAPTLRTVPGCNGDAMAVDYDLTNVAPSGSSNAGQSWIVLQKFFSPDKNLTSYTHIRVAMQGSNLNSHDNIEVKLRDASGLFTTALRSMTDLSAWRAIYLDLREFTGTGTIDLAHIAGLEIAVVRCAGCEVVDNPSNAGPSEEHAGTLYLDEFAAVDLKPGAANRLSETGFETVSANSTIRANAANALLDRIVPCGSAAPCSPGMDLIPAWFPETNPNFNTYAVAEALSVFVSEFQATGNTAFRDVAKRMAAKLISLQIAPGRTQAGAWYTTHTIQGDGLRPPDRSSESVVCDGNETLVADIDTCEWIGNVGWALIALGKLQRGAFYDDPIALKDALDRGAAWIVGQFGRNTGYPDLISLGIEGNISGYFGLLAAGKPDEAALLGSAIYQFGWDSVQRRMKTGVRSEDAPTAMDVSGSWGATFLRSMGRIEEALDSQAYAASVMRVCSFDGSLCAYGDIAGPYTPAVEFTAQAAAAGIKDADFAMQQISSLQGPDNGTYPGAFPGAADHWYGGPLTPWNTTMAGVSPTAWAYFAHSGDPLLELIPPTLLLTVNQASLRTGDTLILTARVIPGSTPTAADVYIALQVPGCTALACSLYWQGDVNFTTTPQPYVSNWSVSAFSGPIFSYTFSGTEQAGSYVWLGAFTVPGTGGILRGIMQAPFTFTP